MDHDEAVRTAVYNGYVEAGAPPSVEQMATQLVLSEDAVRESLRVLHETRHVVLGADGEIVMAHPFASIHLGFSVMGRETLWWGGCAWDAFAIPQLVPDDPEVLVATQCPGCGKPHAWVVNREAPPKPDRANPIVAALAAFGRGGVSFGRNFLVFSEMLGAVGLALGRVITRPRDYRLTSTVHQFDRVAWQAVPIILLITFLIGAIISQQGIFHFRKFGAELYSVDLVGILVLREIGVLIVAIMVAGRSGSSYTAELGSMKMREEIDALRTMGFDRGDRILLRLRNGPDAALLFFAANAAGLVPVTCSTMLTRRELGLLHVDVATDLGRGPFGCPGTRRRRWRLGLAHMSFPSVAFVSLISSIVSGLNRTVSPPKRSTRSTKAAAPSPTG